MIRKSPRLYDLFGRTLWGGLRRAFSGNMVLKKLNGIGAKSARNGRELDDIKATLAILILCDKRLRAAEFFGQRLLANVR